MIHVVDFEKTAFSTPFRGVLPPSGPQIIAESGRGHPLSGTRETWLAPNVPSPNEALSAFTDHWPLATIFSPLATRRVKAHTRRAPPFRLGDARACVIHLIDKDHPHYPNILSLRQNCPTFASVSGSWSLLDGMSAIATGSFLAEPNRSSYLFTAFPPGIPCACPSPRSIVTWTPPAARRCAARAARAAGRAGDAEVP